jgi:hypothetical protein
MRPNASPYGYSYCVTQNEYVNEMQAFLHLIGMISLYLKAQFGLECWRISAAYVCIRDLVHFVCNQSLFLFYMNTSTNRRSTDHPVSKSS